MQVIESVIGDDRAEELLAIINLVDYATGVTRDLGLDVAVSDLETARQKLVLELQKTCFQDLEPDQVRRVAGTAAGHC